MPRRQRLQRNGQSSPEGGERLPWAALLALALAGFVNIMTETMPAGLLPQIAAGVGVSETAVGQWVTAYAAGTVAAAIPAAALTRGLRRKPLLLIAVSGFLVANTVTATTEAYGVAIAARAVAGGFSAVVWGMVAGYARRLVPRHMAGRAMAVAMVGTPLALSIGVPLGTFSGSVVGWRWAFAGMSLLSAILIVWVIVAVPDRPGQPARTRTPLAKVLLIPGVAPVLATTFLWILAHNVLYTYIAPYVHSTGLGVRVDVTLLVFGVAALAGIWFTGTFVDRGLRTLVLCSLTAFALGCLLLGLTGHLLMPYFLAVVVWGFTFGGAATQVQTALSDAAGREGDLATSMLVTSFNLAIFGGGGLGGIALGDLGAFSFPWIVLVVVVSALVIAAVARRHGFPPGPRRETAEGDEHSQSSSLSCTA